MPDTITCLCPIQKMTVGPDERTPGYAVLEVSCWHVDTPLPMWVVTYRGLTAPEVLDVIQVYVGYAEHRHAMEDHPTSLYPV